CRIDLVASPTDPPEGQELATRSILQRDLDQTLRRSRVRACQEPANATLDEALAQLRENAASMRGVLDALGESE
ncbi:MAG: hypothetical protein KBB95_29225, partial [Deltaproteobacteria bacterium]|nr:hypothetical protein [Deltaproteobacteria bacterium]